MFLDWYKLTKNNPHFGNNELRLYLPIDDHTEANNLAESEPELLAKMISSYEKYAEEVNLIEVPEDYNPVLQVQKNVARNQVEEITDKVPATIE